MTRPTCTPPFATCRLWKAPENKRRRRVDISLWGALWGWSSTEHLFHRFSSWGGHVTKCNFLNLKHKPQAGLKVARQGKSGDRKGHSMFVWKSFMCLRNLWVGDHQGSGCSCLDGQRCCFCTQNPTAWRSSQTDVLYARLIKEGIYIKIILCAAWKLHRKTSAKGLFLRFFWHRSIVQSSSLHRLLSQKFSCAAVLSVRAWCERAPVAWGQAPLFLHAGIY